MQSYNLSKINVLILDKNSLIRRLMSNVFHEFGVRKGQNTDDPDTAFDMFQSDAADLIISDWSPELDGIEFIKQIRLNPASPTLRAAICMFLAMIAVPNDPSRPIRKRASPGFGLNQGRPSASQFFNASIAPSGSGSSALLSFFPAHTWTHRS